MTVQVIQTSGVKKTQPLTDQGKQVQRPCGWHVLGVFGVNVAGVDELEETAGVGWGRTMSRSTLQVTMENWDFTPREMGAPGG